MSQEKFDAYKKAESQAIDIARQMTGAGHKIEDIEIALLAAVFECHKGKTLPHTVAKIINNHVSNIGGYYLAQMKNQGKN